MLSIIVVWNNSNGVHDSWKNGQRWIPNPEDTLSMRVMKAVALTTSGKSFGQTLMTAVFFKVRRGSTTEPCSSGNNSNEDTTAD